MVFAEQVCQMVLITLPLSLPHVFVSCKYEVNENNLCTVKLQATMQHKAV